MQDSNGPHRNQTPEEVTQQGIISSKDKVKVTRCEPNTPLCDDNYEDKEPPIQFALFLIVLAAFFAIVTFCINYARTSGWLDDFGKT